MYNLKQKLRRTRAAEGYQNDYVTDRLNAQRILALISLIIPASLLFVFLVMPTASDLVPNPLVTIISLVIIVQAGLRLFLNWNKTLNDRYQLVCVVLDFASLSFILLAYAVTYHVPISVALKSPTANVFFIYLASRVILFNRSILLSTGLIAALAWACLVGLALIDPAFEGRTSSFTEYMTSFKVLLGAEVERILQFGLLTGILYVFLQSIRIDPPTGYLRRVFFMGTISRFLMSAKSRRPNKRFAIVEIRAKNISGMDEVFNTSFNLIPDLPTLKALKVAKIGRLSDQSVAVSIEYPAGKYDLAEIVCKIQSELKLESIAKLANNAPTFVVSACNLDPQLSVNRHLIYTDRAIREAITTGKLSLVFDEALLAQIEYNQSIERAIKTGLEKAGFSVVYQPIMDMMTDVPVGFEALIRLTDENNEPISPSEFIPVAEASGLINEVTEFLCDQVAREAVDIEALFRNHAAKPYLNINISPSQLVDIERVVKALKRAEQSGVKINVEITESTVFNEEAAYRALQALQDEGFAVAIDDFGTGYSSLQRLETLNFSTLKVDQSFVKNIGDPQAYAFLSAIINLARTTSRFTVVEGVETLEQKLLLMKMGVRFCQGYYWGRPMGIRPLGNSLTNIYGFQKVPTKRFGHIGLV